MTQIHVFTLQGCKCIIFLAELILKIGANTPGSNAIDFHLIKAVVVCFPQERYFHPNITAVTKNARNSLSLCNQPLQYNV